MRILDQIADLESEAQLLALEGALNALDNAPDAGACIPSLLAVFERFPWSDGYGLCWSILHAIERLAAYEPLLVASVRRAPGQFNLMMVNNLLNSGVSDAYRVSLLGLLGEVARNQRYSPQARHVAHEYSQHQHKKNAAGQEAEPEGTS